MLRLRQHKSIFVTLAYGLGMLIVLYLFISSNHNHNHKNKKKNKQKQKQTCGGQEYNMTAIEIELGISRLASLNESESFVAQDHFRSKLMPVDDILSGSPKITNKFFDFREKKMQVDIVILIHLYGPNSNRYHLTDKMFAYYKEVQYMFRDYANITFTIVGSEKELSQSLTTKYFSAESYYEFDQNLTLDMKNSEVMYEIIRRKVNFGMKTAHAKDRGDHPNDIVFWVGSNDYISLSFWRQVIEDYNPAVMKWYGLSTYVDGRNVCYFTQFDGKSTLNRFDKIPFFSNGKQPNDRLRFKYIGPVNGVTRSALDFYPSILDYWNHDEGLDEEYVLNIGKSSQDPRHKIHAFESHECFSMNIKGKGNQKQDVTPWWILHDYLAVGCPFEVSQSPTAGLMSDLFLSNFDKEFSHFESIRKQG